MIRPENFDSQRARWNGVIEYRLGIEGAVIIAHAGMVTTNDKMGAA